MRDPLYSLAYISRNAMAGSPQQVQQQITEILAAARGNNARRGITGALLYSDGFFAQLLEGRREDVQAAFDRLRTDARHRDIALLQMQPIDQRSFGAWSMAFGAVDGLWAPRSGQSAGGLPNTTGMLATEAGQALLASLREGVRREGLLSA